METTGHRINALPADAPFARFPTFSIGQFRIPAIILPGIFSMVFLAVRSRIYKRPDYRLSASANAEKKSPGDVENLIQTDADQIESRPRRYLRIALQIYHVTRTVRCIFLLGAEGFDLETACLTETAALLVAGTLVDPKLSLACAAVGLGWVTIYIRCWFGTPAHLLTSSMIGVSVLLALWPRQTARRKAFMGVFWSAALLMCLAVEPHLPAESRLRKLEYPGQQLWPITLTFGLFGVAEVFRWLQDSATPTAGWIIIRDNALGIADAVDGIAAVAVCFFFVSFAASCMGFRWLLLDQSSTSPAFTDAGRIAGVLAMFPYMCFAHWELAQRQGEVAEKGTCSRKETHYRICAFAAGWTVVGLLGVALFVLSVRLIFN